MWLLNWMKYRDTGSVLSFVYNHLFSLFCFLFCAFCFVLFFLVYTSFIYASLLCFWCKELKRRHLIVDKIQGHLLTEISLFSIKIHLGYIMVSPISIYDSHLDNSCIKLKLLWNLCIQLHASSDTRVALHNSKLVTLEIRDWTLQSRLSSNILCHWFWHALNIHANSVLH